MSKFQVPPHVESVTFGDGCGKTHKPDKDGFISCDECARVRGEHTFHEPAVDALLVTENERPNAAAVEELAEDGEEPKAEKKPARAAGRRSSSPKAAARPKSTRAQKSPEEKAKFAEAMAAARAKKAAAKKAESAEEKTEG